MRRIQHASGSLLFSSNITLAASLDVAMTFRNISPGQTAMLHSADIAHLSTYSNSVSRVNGSQGSRLSLLLRQWPVHSRQGSRAESQYSITAINSKENAGPLSIH
ncbi:hypothetical protein BDV06DRAFT_189098 [Aspergillus oleicola]